jgi:hypothetical protein
MRKILTIVVCLLFTAGITVNAQRYYYFNDKYMQGDITAEIGASIGFMNAFTDLGGRKGIGKGFIKDLNLKKSKPSASIYLAANFRDALTLKLEGTFGKIEAYDTILKKVKQTTFGRYERNLSFRSRITDFMLAAELHPLMWKSYIDEEPPYFSPYVMAGIGYFSFNPQARVNGQWYDLQPLRTEGQGFREYPDSKPYKLQQLNIPIGVGVRYEISPVLNARFEIVHRILRTDHLDDVGGNYIDPALFSSYLSPQQAAIAQLLFDRRNELDPTATPLTGVERGDVKDNDAFFSVQLKIGYTLRTKRNGY